MPPLTSSQRRRLGRPDSEPVRRRVVRPREEDHVGGLDLDWLPPAWAGRKAAEGLAALSPRKPDDRDILREAWGNLLPSAGRAFLDVTAPLHSPIDTGKGVYRLGRGIVHKLMPGRQGGEAAAEAAWDHMKDRYGGIGALRNTFATDPVGLVSDVAGLFTLGGLTAAKGAGTAARISRRAAAHQRGRAGALTEEVRDVAAGAAPKRGAEVIDPATGEILNAPGRRSTYSPPPGRWNRDLEEEIYVPADMARQPEYADPKFHKYRVESPIAHRDRNVARDPIDPNRDYLENPDAGRVQSDIDYMVEDARRVLVDRMRPGSGLENHPNNELLRQFIDANSPHGRRKRARARELMGDRRERAGRIREIRGRRRGLDARAGRLEELGGRLEDAAGRARTMARVSDVLDPSAGIARGVGAGIGAAASRIGTSIAMGQARTTGAPVGDFAEAYRSGREGGQRGERFRENLRTHEPQDDVINDVRDAIQDRRDDIGDAVARQRELLEQSGTQTQRWQRDAGRQRRERIRETEAADARAAEPPGAGTIDQGLSEIERIFPDHAGAVRTIRNALDDPDSSVRTAAAAVGVEIDALRRRRVPEAEIAEYFKTFEPVKAARGLAGFVQSWKDAFSRNIRNLRNTPGSRKLRERLENQAADAALVKVGRKPLSAADVYDAYRREVGKDEVYTAHSEQGYVDLGSEHNRYIRSQVENLFTNLFPPVDTRRADVPPVDVATADRLLQGISNLGGSKWSGWKSPASHEYLRRIRRTIEKDIARQVPEYDTLLRDRRDLYRHLADAQSASGVGNRGGAADALNRLSSAMHQGGRTGRMRRDYIDSLGADDLRTRLAGQTLSEPLPYGRLRRGASGVTVAALAAGLNPGALALSPVTSPRLMGELDHAAGRLAGSRAAGWARSALRHPLSRSLADDVGAAGGLPADDDDARRRALEALRRRGALPGWMVPRRRRGVRSGPSPAW